MSLKNHQLLILFIIGLTACNPNDDSNESVKYDPTPYELNYPSYVPDPQIPQDNPLTKEGVKLGRMLFYETMLSSDESMSCASCHLQSAGFSDPNTLSIGLQGLAGHRQAMGVFNMAWNDNGFFWDGRAELLRHQSLLPIQDPLEMDEDLDNVIAKLSISEVYRNQFVRAFGKEDITSHKIALALEQFMNSIVSFDSKYDRFLAGLEELTESEERGRQLFITEYNPFFPELSGADCNHCHGGFNFENDEYMNNGLDDASSMQDVGHISVTGNQSDWGKFKVTSLRNIALTAPYMHDGRFSTLEEVIEHYNSGIQSSATLNPALENPQSTGLMLSPEDIEDLIAFLNTLTDEQLALNSAYANPF
ncbi:MAG: hypothetical protein RL226_2135 [Bacteroidota bacterium]